MLYYLFPRDPWDCLENSSPFPGLELMAIFEKEVENLEKIRQELGSVEKLFDLPVTVYSDLMKAQNDMKNLKQIYEIYELQRVSIALCIHRHTRIRVHRYRKGGGEKKRLHCLLVTINSVLSLCMK